MAWLINPVEPVVGEVLPITYPTGTNLQPSNTGPLGWEDQTPTGNIHTDVLTIVTKNVIPPLSAAYGGTTSVFGQLTINRVTIAVGDPGVTFTEGSTQVTVNPALLGFNVNPGDLVIAQYTSET